MLRGTSPLLRLPARALLQGKQTSASAAPFHRLSAPNGVLTRQRPSLSQATSVVWRAQYTSKPFIPPSEIKKQEQESAQRKLEAHPERVTSTSTTAGALLPDTEPAEGAKVSKEDKDEVLGSLKQDIVSLLQATLSLVYDTSLTE